MPDGTRGPDDSLTGATGAGMPPVRVECERERAAGWSFDVVIEPDDRRTVTMSWADYELWCGGAKAPSAMAEQVVVFALRRRLLSRLGARFDASTVRRMAADMDRAIGDRSQD